MDGRPVWLASISHVDAYGEIIGTAKWSRKQMRREIDFARRTLLAGIGDPTVERVFRMNVTICVHRLCTAEEVATVDPIWRDLPKGALAGPPIEILEERGCVTSPSCAPCADPGHVVAISARPDLWIPGDCGSCESCLARAAIVVS